LKRILLAKRLLGPLIRGLSFSNQSVGFPSRLSWNLDAAGPDIISIFFGEHDRDHAVGDRWISGIVGVTA
jgi:hypothetical protein